MSTLQASMAGLPATAPLPGTAHHHNGWRNTTVAGVVFLAHAAALSWAVQHNPMPKPVDLVIPVQLIASFVAPPAPVVSAPLPEPEAPEPPAEQALVPEPDPLPEPPPPEPEPLPETEPAPAPPAPAKKPVPQPKPQPKPKPRPPAPQPRAESAPQPRPVPTPVAAPAPAPEIAAPASPPPAPVVVQPSTSANYLNNPAPAYPALSRRLGESGRVVIRLLVGTDGRALEAHVARSSGFERLDQTALETARDRWRYAPGTRGGTPEPMWVMVPINFVLD